MENQLNRLKLFLTILSIILVTASFIPNINSKHWSVRAFDFLKIQLSVVIVLSIGCSLFVSFDNYYVEIALKLALLLALSYNLYFIYPFLPKRYTKASTSNENFISLISLNVKQDNTAYNKLVDLVNRHKPEVLLTMESNKDWENGMKSIDGQYKHNFKIPQENKYGMHFYTNLDVVSIKKHFLISREYPSIEANLITQQGIEFKFWGIHPPPPSPTEKPTSKQKDAELLVLAKKLSKEKLPVIVAGDFNNVSWSKTSRLFAQVSGLKDARVGKGIYGTFPAYACLLRFPIDLVFNSLNIRIGKITTLPSVNSDHLPLLVKFNIIDSTRSENLNTDFDAEKVNKTIKEGKKEKNYQNSHT